MTITTSRSIVWLIDHTDTRCISRNSHDLQPLSSSGTAAVLLRLTLFGSCAGTGVTTGGGAGALAGSDNGIGSAAGTGAGMGDAGTGARVGGPAAANSATVNRVDTPAETTKDKILKHIPGTDAHQVGFIMGLSCGLQGGCGGQASAVTPVLC